MADGHASNVSDEEDDSENNCYQYELKGFLSKWTNYIHGWQRRYIVLKDGTLSYYKSEQETGFGCRGAISLFKATIKPHEFDECRFDVSVNDCVWYLRAESAEDRQYWIDILEAFKAESGYGSENSLKRHGSAVSLASNTVSTASASSFKKGLILKEKLAEMETYKDILCNQMKTLQGYFDTCADTAANKTQGESEVVKAAVDFRGEALTFRETTAAMLSNLQQCLDAVGQREDIWRRRLEREVDKRKQLENALLGNRKHPTLGPDLEENASCTEDCVRTNLHINNAGETLKRAERDNELELLCHGIDRIALKWCEIPEFIYTMTYSLVNDTSWILIKQITECSLMLRALKPLSVYNVILEIISDDGQVSRRITRQFTTLPDNEPLAPINAIQLQNVWANSPFSASAKLTWDIPSGLPCHYGLILWRSTASSHANMSQVKYPDPLDHVQLSRLEFGTSYKFGVRAMPGPNTEWESQVTWFLFDVPPCLDFFPGNLSVCKPTTPAGLVAEDQLTDDGRCKLHLVWECPTDVPDRYNLTINQYDIKTTEFRSDMFNISGNSSEVIVPGLDQLSDVLLVLYAESPAGASDSVKLHLTDICNNQYTGNLKIEH